MDLIIGGLAGSGATLVSNPMDVVKVRMQLQGELRTRDEHKKTKHYRNVFHAMYVIAKTDGPLALQTGLAPAMILGFILNGIRLGTFHLAEGNGLTKNDKGDVCLYKASFWSALGGTVGGTMSNPTFVVKTRMQAASHPSIAVGRQHVYNGTMDAVYSIYKTDGVKGFFAGVKATAIRLGIGSASQLTTFSAAKQAILKRGFCKDSPIGLAFLASLLNGIVVSICVCPLDVVTVRLYNQGSDKQLYTSGIFGVISKIYRIEGLHGLYKGFLPLYIRIAPHTTATLVIWDALYTFLYPQDLPKKKILKCCIFASLVVRFTPRGTIRVT